MIVLHIIHYISHNFKLEKWADMGPSILAAFASEQMEDVLALRNAIESSLRQCPHGGLKSIRDLLPAAASSQILVSSSSNHGHANAHAQQQQQ
jgi:hypothetical protein